MPGVTAKEIAEKLNLSQSTVSLALNGRPGVNENTRALVLETAMQLGYSRPDTTAPPPARTICFIRYAGRIVQIAEHTSFASFVLQGVESRATELGYTTQVRYLNAGDMYNPQTLNVIRNAGGIIFLGTDITETQLPELEQLFESLGDTPVVVVDNNLLSAQMELRQKLFWRVGVAAFVGFGSVFPSFKELRPDHILPTYGVGLRFEFKHNVNLRVDYGFGRGTSGFVLSLGESF